MTEQEALEVLGVAIGASWEEIKAAYLLRAKGTHPDVRGGGARAADEFQRVQAAYAALHSLAGIQVAASEGGAGGSAEIRGNTASEGTEAGAVGPLPEAPRSDPVELVRAFLDERDIEVLFDGSYRVRSAPRMALTADQIDAYLRVEPIDLLKIIDDLLLETKAAGIMLSKSDAERALRKVTREAQGGRRFTVSKALLAPPPTDERARAQLQWTRLAEVAFDTDPALTIAVLQHFVWQVKCKLRNLPIKHHLMPVVLSPVQGSGKTTFVRHFLSPLQELATGPALLSDFADRRSSDIYRFPAVFIDDMEAISPNLVPILKSLMTSEGMSRRKLGTSLSVAIPQKTTLIGTANSGIERLVTDDTGHRRFVVLAFHNGEVATGGDSRVWDLVREIDYMLLWRSVDVEAPTPLIPHLASLYSHQASSRPADMLRAWLIHLDFDREAVGQLRRRSGVKAKELYDLFVQDTESDVTMTSFGKRMGELAADPAVPFGSRIRDKDGIIYTLKLRDRPAK